MTVVQGERLRRERAVEGGQKKGPVGQGREGHSRETPSEDREQRNIK